jgi:hypothetical protein
VAIWIVAFILDESWMAAFISALANLVICVNFHVFVSFVALGIAILPPATELTNERI